MTEAVPAAEALLRGHPAVADAAVYPAGDGQPLVAVAPVGFLNGPEVREILRAVLAPAEVPARVAVLDELPRRPDGDLDAAELHRRVANLPGGVYQYEPAGDELEHQLVALWMELLGRPEVGATDDFIDVGGDSMSGVELVNRVDELFGVQLDLDEVFQNTTVRGLAAAIRAQQLG